LLRAKQKVPQGYSPAGENAGSLMPFEMTVDKSDSVYDVQSSAETSLGYTASKAHKYRLWPQTDSPDVEYLFLYFVF
jgi:hypothetical protein